MPYHIITIQGKKYRKFAVQNKDTGKLFSHGSSKQDALKQMKLLQMLPEKKKIKNT